MVYSQLNNNQNDKSQTDSETTQVIKKLSFFLIKFSFLMIFYQTFKTFNTLYEVISKFEFI